MCGDSLMIHDLYSSPGFYARRRLIVKLTFRRPFFTVTFQRFDKINIIPNRAMRRVGSIAIGFITFDSRNKVAARLTRAADWISKTARLMIEHSLAVRRNSSARELTSKGFNSSRHIKLQKWALSRHLPV